MATPSLILMQPPEPDAARGPQLGELEETLRALLDCEETVTAEQRESWQADIDTALKTTIAKRDRYQRFLVSLEEKIAAGAGEIAGKQKEIARLKTRQATLEGKLEQAEQYVLRVVQSLSEPDAHGKYPLKLEGSIVTFSAQKNPPSVDDSIDEARLPAQYKTVTLSMPASLWDEVLDTLDLEMCRKLEEARPKVEISKAAIKADLTAKPPVPVPGAALKLPSYKLVRK